jgi:hypothetical protein
MKVFLGKAVFLRFPQAMRKVIWIRIFQEFAIPTTQLEIFASSTVVASTRKGPHIVKCPKNRFVQSGQGRNILN